MDQSLDKFERHIPKRGAASIRWRDWLKWLRFYLDFGKQYGLPPRESASLLLALQKRFVRLGGRGREVQEHAGRDRGPGDGQATRMVREGAQRTQGQGRPYRGHGTHSHSSPSQDLQFIRDADRQGT